MESKTFILSNELYDQYTNKAKEYAGLWGIDDAHVIQIMTSIMLHRDGLRKGGGFVEAVVVKLSAELMTRSTNI